MRTTLVSLVMAALVPLACLAQTAAPTAKQAPPIPMPTNRAADSYQIYSSLLPLGETASPGWPHDLWLIADTTIAAVPQDQPCKPPAKADQTDMNPHVAVHPSDDRRQDFQEILDDFDAHCHDRIALNAESFNTKVPVRLLTPDEQKEFSFTRGGILRPVDPAAVAAAKAKYAGAPSLYSFSEVYFNLHRTVALVYATHWCGSLCGQGFWIAFALDNGHWKSLNWDATTWIS